MRNLIIGVSFLGLFLLSIGCQEPILVDPVVMFTKREAIVAVGEPGISIGVYEEQLFRPLHESASTGLPEVEIIYGFQGGTWLMPAIRCTGVSQTVSFTADLSGENGEVLGHVPASRVRLDLTPDGTLDANALPIPVIRANSDEDTIEDLYGTEGHIFIQGTDDRDVVIGLELAVAFVEG